MTITIILTQSDVNFICKSGHLLNGTENICDGFADCFDGSDEAVELCSHILCPPKYFKCNYGACVPRTKKCNGIRDCVDSSDETNCGRKWQSCMSNEFNCGRESDDNNSYRYCIDASRICDGNQDCANGADENETICEKALCPESSYRCKYGGCVSENVLCDGFSDCMDGSDESLELCVTINCPKCINSIPCPPLYADNINSFRVSKKCEWNGRQMPCSQNILPGTKVTYACKDHFKPKSNRDFSNNWNLCQADGTWLRDMLECEPNCGQLSAGIPLITNNLKLSQTMPWYATIFVIEKKQRPKFICGATLISEALIVTAAHCVWKFNADNLRIGLGNMKAEYQHPDDFSARFYKAGQILVHPNYVDQFANYGSDIALIEILTPVELDDIISPICIDWNLDDISTQPNEKLGIVVALGMTSISAQNNSLHVLQIPVISHSECIDRQTVEFQQYLSFTKFCGGWANGTSACNGDSGSGLAFKQSDGRFYLQGITSISPREGSTNHCDPNQYTLFTKVGIFVKWIENHLNEINDRYIQQH